MKAMILAAGYGKRMRPLTDHVPKPLLTVADKPLIEWIIEGLASAGIRDIVINHAHLGQQIVDHLGDGSHFGVHIVYSKERQPLEAAGGIAKALPLLGDDPVLVVNADIFTDFDFSTLTGYPFQENLLAHLVLVDNPPHHPDGDFTIDAQSLLGRDGDKRYTFAGISLLNPVLFRQAGIFEGALLPLFLQGIEQQSITAIHYSGQWTDVGTPERLDQIRAQVVAQRTAQQQ